MAILNEYAVMGPNYWMLIGGIASILGFLALLIFIIINDEVALTAKGAFLVVVVMLACFLFGWFNLVLFNDPGFERPTGKTQIEATFANGEIPSYYLKQYDVIDVYEDGVYLLQKKDGVKESRPKVRIYEERAE